jgi:hypothetical protein
MAADEGQGAEWQAFLNLDGGDEEDAPLAVGAQPPLVVVEGDGIPPAPPLPALPAPVLPEGQAEVVGQDLPLDGVHEDPAPIPPPQQIPG